MPPPDVAVVGAGFLGSAIALELASRGVTVCLVDQMQPRSGRASEAAGAMLGVFSEVSSRDDPGRRELEVASRWEARQRYDGWLAGLAERSAVEVAVTPGLFVVANSEGEDDLAELEAIAEATVGRASAERVAPRDVPGLHPERGAVAFAALHLAQEGTVDGDRLTRALRAALAREPRITVVDDLVTRLRPEDNGVRVATVGGQELSAGCAVLACGIGIPTLLHASHMDALDVPPLVSGRGVGVIARAALGMAVGVRTPNRGFACGLHMVPRAGGEVYLGATNRLSTLPAFGTGPTLAEVATVITGAMRELNTNLRSAEVVRTTMGHRPVAPDRLPVVGRTEDPRLLIASGTYRNGALLAPLVAGLIAEEYMEPGRHARHAFRPGRLGAASEPMDELLLRASRSLVSLIRQPGTVLGPGQGGDLEGFFRAVLGVLLEPGRDLKPLLQRIERITKRSPVEESIPLIFELLARHG
ncbi:MAG: hypothetical protein NVSMB32_10510 [Actinomycetota bacterium]